MDRAARESINRAANLLIAQGYHQVSSDYALRAYAQAEVMSKAVVVVVASIAHFAKADSTARGKYHLVSFGIDNSKPSEPFMVGVTASVNDVREGSYSTRPIPTVKPADFVSQIGTESALDYFNGLSRNNPAGRSAERGPSA